MARRATKTSRRQRNPVAGVTALAYGLPNPAAAVPNEPGPWNAPGSFGALAPARPARRSNPPVSAAWGSRPSFVSAYGAGAPAGVTRTPRKAKKMPRFTTRSGKVVSFTARGGHRRRRNFTTQVKGLKKVGYTRHRKVSSRKYVFKGTPLSRHVKGKAIWRKKSYVYVAGKRRNVTGWRRYYKRPLKSQSTKVRRARRKNPARLLKRDSRGRFLKRRQNPAKRRAVKRHSVKRRSVARRLRTWSHVPARRRRRNPRGIRRWRNPATALAAVAPAPLRPLVKALVPGLIGAGGFLGGRFAANKLSAFVIEKGWLANEKVASVGAGALVLSFGAFVLPKIKAIPGGVAAPILIGMGVDLGLRIIGALLPATQSELAAVLLGTSGWKLAASAATTAPAGYYGYGQPDIYESGGQMGAYTTQYSPVQGGIGSYIQDGGAGAIGSYLQDTGGDAVGLLPPHVGVQEAPAGYGYGFGVDVQEAPAGLSAFVQEAPAGLAGLDDRALNEQDARLEGLGEAHRAAQARGGQMLYSTPNGALAMARGGHDVQGLTSNSRRYPGVGVVAVTPGARQPELVGGPGTGIFQPLFG